MSNRPAFDHAMKTVRVLEIGGFSMYALEAYPFVVPTGNAEDRIIVELVEISSLTEVKRLCEFEFSVGYELAEVQIDDRLAGIFIFNHDKAATFAKPEKWIRRGDWVNFNDFKRSP